MPKIRTARIVPDMPEEYGKCPAQADYPNDADHRQRPFLGALPQVLQRISYGPVTIERQNQNV